LTTYLHAETDHQALVEKRRKAEERKNRRGR
jgi:hypothetical protein